MAFHAIGWNMVGISEFLSHSDPFGYIWIGAHLASKLETGVSIYVCLILLVCGSELMASWLSLPNFQQIHCVWNLIGTDGCWSKDPTTNSASDPGRAVVWSWSLALSGFSRKTWFPKKDVYGTPSHVSDFADLLWKTGFAQRRYRALSNELCFPFLKWATSIKRTLDVHSWKEPEEAIEMAAEDRQLLLRFTALLWCQLCLTLIWR